MTNDPNLRRPYPLVSAEAAGALTMPLHTLIREADCPPKATCDAPEGAKCRLVCAEDCGAESWPCGGDYDGDGEREPHPMKDGGFCNVVLFLDDDLDACAEVEGDPELLAYSGPIKVQWEADYYAWAPATSDQQRQEPS